ncbi:MAG TPA: hypothetical protein VG816_06030 [Solirubrobacterales bacterium]|nr:hypothetical protein [Solirubrobacterales bacterium]
MVMVVYAAHHLKTDDVFQPEIVLPLVVIVGIVALLATLAIAAATFGLFNISDAKQALGLPAGSIQAVIALSLILIFAVVALYASGGTKNQQLTSTGLSRAQLKSIPPQQVIQVQRNKGKKGKKSSFTVVRTVEDQNAREINIQLLSTVSTLVIAVAGFYFGSKSVQEGVKAAKAPARDRTLSVASPVSPHHQPVGRELRGIKVHTVPGGSRVRWVVHGDAKGEVAQHEDGTYTYTPGQSKKAGESVGLHFSQVDDPKVADTLVVNFTKRLPEHEGKPAVKKRRKAKPRTQTA